MEPVKLDPPKFPVREQGPLSGLVSSLKYYSKTRIDKNRHRAPSGVGKTSQQKRHPVRSALKNGGAVVRDEITSPVRVRRKSLFIRQLAGNYR